MNIFDAVIIVFLILGVIVGIKNGFLKELIGLVGLILVFVIAYSLKGPVSTFLLKFAPFWDFWGAFKGAQVLNILLYELIAFLSVALILSIILGVILKITGIFERILEITIVFGFVSKILGALFGFIKAYIFAFVIIFVLSQPYFQINSIYKSKVADFILHKTPILAPICEKTTNVIDELYEIKEDLSDAKNTDEFNKKGLDIILKHKLTTIENVKMLKEKNKLNFNGLNTVIKKYGG